MEKKKCLAAVCLLAAFALWTAAVCLVDVQPIGPEGTSVGFAAINGFVHDFFGVHMVLYVITDWLGLVPFAVAFAFGMLGLLQWRSRKKITAVDRSILALGGFYTVVIAAYVLFEIFVVNFRPVLINGVLEASYPSSTTMLTLCIMPTAVMQLRGRIGNSVLLRLAGFAATAFAVSLVVLRLLSGVHWATDIVGGALLSGGLVMLYDSVASQR